MPTKSNIVVSCSEDFLRALSSKSLDAVNFAVERTSLSPNDFLAQQPTGCYFAARTLNQKSIMNFQRHLNRLMHGIKNKNFDLKDGSSLEESNELNNINERLESLRNSNTLFPLIKHLCKFGLENYFKEATPETEAKLTFLLSYDRMAELPVVKLHVSPLVTPKTLTCEVDILIHSRSNPDIKDSQWVRDRHELEKSMAPGINEVLLMDTDGNISEGMSSNFFAVVKSADGHQVWTSPLEYVLRGTVMDMVLDGCKHLNIPLVFKFPTIHDAIAGSWSGAFITSTSRLMLPIEKLHIRSPHAISVSLQSPNNEPYIGALLNYVKAHMESSAMSLL